MKKLVTVDLGKSIGHDAIRIARCLHDANQTIEDANLKVGLVANIPQAIQILDDGDFRIWHAFSVTLTPELLAQVVKELEMIKNGEGGWEGLKENDRQRTS